MIDSQRIALGVEYDGSDFQGWQRQETGPTVQAVLEDAISRVAFQQTGVFCAGRTDTGVHAQHQVIHFDTTASRELKAWSMGVNTNLPPSIRVKWAKSVSSDFHARFSAISRTYEYWIYRDTSASSIFRQVSKWHYRPLNVAKMSEAAEYLIGEQDFSSFRASGCQAKGPVRTITEAKLSQFGKMLVIKVRANAFLYHMVRNIVGVLLMVGEEKIEPIGLKDIIEAKNRRLAGPTAPAKGLHLVAVGYPEEFAIPTPKLSDMSHWMETAFP